MELLGWFVAGVIGIFLLMPETYKEIEKSSGWNAVGVFIAALLLALICGALLLVAGLIKVIYRATKTDQT